MADIFLSRGCKNNLALVLKDRDDKTRFDSQKAPIEPSFLQNIKVAASERHWDFFPIGHRFDRWNSLDISKICLAQLTLGSLHACLAFRWPICTYVCMQVGRYV